MTDELTEVGVDGIRKSLAAVNKGSQFYLLISKTYIIYF